MPFHTITQPAFSLADFAAASLDYILAHPLALAAFIAAAFLVVVELVLRISHRTAERQVAAQTEQRRLARDRARKDLLETIARNHSRGKDVA